MGSFFLLRRKSHGGQVMPIANEGRFLFKKISLSLSLSLSQDERERERERERLSPLTRKKR